MDALGGGAAPMAIDERGFVVPTGEPVGSSGGVVMGPLYAAFAVAAGLARARATGEGCYIDVSCADAVIAGKWLGAMAMLNPQHVDRSSARGGGDGTGSAKYQHYETKDGKYILFCAIEAKFWDHWCKAIGREDLIGDHRTDLVVDFGDGDGNLRLEIQKEFHKRTQAEWMDIAIEHDIALGPALRFDEIQSDPHLQARGQVVTEQHPVFGEILTLGNPIVVPGKEFSIRSAPSHGQHTDEVLAELGYDETAREKLRANGVV
jgi:crotonobetainyl-CoA:carnitine CoA-transferase CaiB-like acyl-CoA transferase